MIYFLLNPGSGRVKIGFTAKEIARRQDNLETGSDRPLTLLGTVPGGRDVEDAWHERFADLRRHREWFEFRDDLPRAVGLAVAESPAGEGMVRPAEFLAYAELVGMLRQHGWKAFSARGPLGRGVNEIVKAIARGVFLVSGLDGMHRVADAVEEFACREYGDLLGGGVMSNLDHRFDGIGGWYA